jgi:hypothetical protein
MCVSQHFIGEHLNMRQMIIALFAVCALGVAPVALAGGGDGTGGGSGGPQPVDSGSGD